MVVETKAEKLTGEKLLFMTRTRLQAIANAARSTGYEEGRKIGFAAARLTAATADELQDCEAMAAIRRHRLQVSYDVCDCDDCRGQEGFFMVHTTDGRRTKGDQDLARLVLGVAEVLEAEAAAREGKK